MDNQGSGLVRQLYQRPNIIMTYTPNGQKGCVRRSFPYCNQCSKYHPDPRSKKCQRCQKPGHRIEVCRSLYPVKSSKSPGSCYHCGIFGHFRMDCPLINQNADKMPKVTLMERYRNNHQDYDKCQWIDSHYVKSLESRVHDLEEIIGKIQIQDSESRQKRMRSS